MKFLVLNFVTRVLKAGSRFSEKNLNMIFHSCKSAEVGFFFEVF